ncbi:unnamed protein product [Callosobruchus maculatus]|uniref:Protein kinase domain-containing protein n=1 Tax=Callosobruchus maculatus TaxID=64391 RepID=A0A653DR50_CALMS|nr:unnamed protein product [Callosobruchus maculatus]
MENVMLNPSQTQIKIVDFGLSNTWRPDAPLRTHCGSPEYAAPELFVTGKQYGPEVDLWSLGIILYGMVLGQLPFVSSNKNDHLSSQERRKHLVAQINKGLSSSHRKALASFSTEFKALMSRLLVSDSSKRINAKELLIHPWITDKARRIIRANPMRSVDPFWQNKIISEIATMAHTDMDTVLAAVKEEPLGKIGGLYNILLHRFQLNQLHGDGIVKRVPSLTLMEAEARRTKDKDSVKIHTERPSSRRGTDRPYTLSYALKRMDYCTPRISMPSQQTAAPEMVRPETSPMHVSRKTVANMRPKHVETSVQSKEIVITQSSYDYKHTQHQARITPLIDYRCIKDPTLRRKAYSATITPKTHRPYSPLKTLTKTNDKEIPKKDIPVTTTSSAKKDADPQEPRIITLHSSFKSSYPQKSREPTKSSTQQTRSATANQKSRPIASSQKTRPQSQQSRPPAANVRSKSDHKKVAETKDPFYSVMNSAIKLQGNLVKPRTATYTTRAKKIEAENWEKSHLAYGDMNRILTAPQKQRKAPIYDPIARSIAEYISNNVPERLHNLPWLRS